MLKVNFNKNVPEFLESPKLVNNRDFLDSDEDNLIDSKLNKNKKSK